MVLVVEESRRFFVDLAAYVAYAMTDDSHLDIQRIVRLRTSRDDTDNSLRVIADTDARGT